MTLNKLTCPASSSWDSRHSHYTPGFYAGPGGQVFKLAQVPLPMELSPQLHLFKTAATILPLCSHCLVMGKSATSPVDAVCRRMRCHPNSSNAALSVPQLVDDNNTTRKVAHYAVRPGERFVLHLVSHSREQVSSVFCALHAQISPSQRIIHQVSFPPYSGRSKRGT